MLGDMILQVGPWQCFSLGGGGRVGVKPWKLLGFMAFIACDFFLG